MDLSGNIVTLFSTVDAWMELKDRFLNQTNQINDKHLGEYAMVDHESPSH